MLGVDPLFNPEPSARARFRIDDRVASAFPMARIGIVVAYGLSNGPSDERSRRALGDSVAHLARTLEGQTLGDQPQIKAWREIYRRFGAKPARYPCSAEALAARALKTGSAPAINKLVDHYNAISLRRLTPIGGEDLDALTGELVLRFSDAGERFDIPDDPTAEFAVLPLGEVVWADAAGVTCRRWNWRQGRRTRLTEGTRNAYFIVETLQPSQAPDALGQALQELEDALRLEGRARSTDSWILTMHPGAGGF